MLKNERGFDVMATMRLQKFLAEAQVASRRGAEEIILNGRVTVNGAVVNVLGTKVDETDVVALDGKVIKPTEKLVYIMLHKPEGYVTTVKDQFDRPTVLDLVGDIEQRIYPVGRLDYDTSGMLLLTNDGDLTYRLTHPKHNVEKVYIAQVKGEPSPQQLKRFSNGLVIDNSYKTAPAKIFVAKRDKLTSLKITIHEGKNRQVRKMCEEIGFPVIRLKRIATGKLKLGNLKKGEYRHLTNEEIKYLKSL